MVTYRLGQRNRHRRGVRREGLCHLSAPAWPGRVHRNGCRSRDMQENRRALRRLHLDRHVLCRWNPVRVHLTHSRAQARGLRKPAHSGRSTAMTPAGRPIDVLLIEDDPGDELIIREAFEHNKLQNRLQVAHDGEEGLDYLYQRGSFENVPRPDLILLDLNLPKYDGRQLLERVKSDPDLARIPVVVLTTSSAEEDILRSYKLQAARQRLRHQAGRPRPVHQCGPAD